MRRSGFTLVELLVVMTISSILLSIGFVVYGSAIENTRAVATRTTLVELQLAVDSRASAVDRFNAKPLAQRLIESYGQGGNPAPNQTIPHEVALILVKKDLYKQALPSRLEDLWGIDGQPGTPDDAPLWRAWKNTVNSYGVPATDAIPRPVEHRRDLENSELLYLTLTAGGTFGNATTDLSRIRSNHTRDANGNGIPEFIDEWGNPIRFYNWTHRLVRPGGTATAINRDRFMASAHVLLTQQSPPASPSPYPHDAYNHPLNQDLDDPTGALSAAMAATGLLASPFQIDHDLGPGTNIVSCPAFGETHYHALDTYGPSLVVSAGPDGRLGLVEPTEETQPETRTGEPLSYSDPSRLDELFDNITTRH